MHSYERLLVVNWITDTILSTWQWQQTSKVLTSRVFSVRESTCFCADSNSCRVWINSNCKQTTFNISHINHLHLEHSWM